MSPRDATGPGAPAAGKKGSTDSDLLGRKRGGSDAVERAKAGSGKGVWLGVRSSPSQGSSTFLGGAPAACAKAQGRNLLGVSRDHKGQVAGVDPSTGEGLEKDSERPPCCLA